MTVTNTTNRWTDVGTGSVTEFFFTNRIFAAADLKVYVAGVLKTLGTEYTVKGVGNPAGGRVVFTLPPAVGASIVIVRQVPPTQGLDMVSLGSFPAEENEKALDRLTVLAQQLENRADRALRQPEQDAADLAPLPPKADRAGRLLGFSDAGDPVTTIIGLPSGLQGQAGSMPRVAGSEPAYELRTPAQLRADLELVVGTQVQDRLARRCRRGASDDGDALAPAPRMQHLPRPPALPGLVPPAGRETGPAPATVSSPSTWVFSWPPSIS